MRDYGKVSPQFWTGGTGKTLRRDPDAQRVAFYLMTSPHANMIGVYHLPVVYVANDVGIPLQGASEALARLSEAGFCTYSEGSEWVFVHNFAEHQVGEALKPGDNRLLGISRELAKVADAALQLAFWEKYAEVYRLPELPKGKPLASPLQAPCKPEAVTGAEKKEDQGASPAGDALPAEPKSDPIPYLRIVTEFNRIMVKLPKVRDITANRKTAIRVAWQASESRQSVEFWTALFEEYADDPFLNGTGPYKPPHENWRPDFDHLLKPKVITKVYERAMDRLERAA